jgi:hypothetical protein
MLEHKTDPEFKTSFVDGSKNAQMSTIKEHRASPDHTRSSRAHSGLTFNQIDASGTIPITNFFKSKIENAKFNVMIPTFNDIYFLAYENLSLLKAESLHKLMRTSGVEISEHYADKNAAKDIMLCIADSIQQDISKEIRNANFVGLSFDSSQDIMGNNNFVVLYVHVTLVRMVT